MVTKNPLLSLNWAMRLRQRCILLLVVLMSVCSVQAADQQNYDDALTSWSQVLSGFVDNQGRTDFIALSQRPEPLEHFVSFIGQVSPDSHPQLFPESADVLAYHINAYNALAMYGVIKRDIPADFDSFFKRLRFFKFRKVIIGGAETSLQDYENDVIRPLGDERAHFALNCMVRDCPRLPRKPFKAEVLDNQLEALAVEFFNKPKHLRIDYERHIVFVSAILRFYTEDFVPLGSRDDLLIYINRYRDSKIPADYQVKFMDYDWTINQQP